MTAVAVAHPWARPTAAVAPAPSRSLLRVTGTLHEPNTWTVGVLLATGLVLLARHPIAHLLGTEVDSAPTPVVATAPVQSHLAVRSVPSLALSAPVPTHAPRDPFRALVSASGKVLAAKPAVPAAGEAASAVAVPAPVAPPATAVTPAAPAVVSPTCTGTTHRVVAGDTLWTIAARAVRSNDSNRVTLAWHRIYSANRDSLGSNPSLLKVGASLCVPQSI